MSHLLDGLGGEQVQTLSGASLPTQSAYFTGSVTVVSGLIVTQGGLTVTAGGQTISADGLDVTGSIISSDQISGTNVYAKTAMQADTILGDVVISGLTLDVGNSLITGSLTASVSIEANALASSVGALSAAGTGSPTTWGRAIQAGNATTDGGSSLWVSYGTAFGSAPNVVATSAETQESILVKAGSIVVGSFYVESKTASQDFQWIAVGPAA